MVCIYIWYAAQMREQWNTKTTISKIINLRCDFVVNASCKRMQNKKNT
ncbi:hypothetical protein HOT39_gp52 [Escherichia phage LL5]|uniref:Uncharacterized protein n=1 Tax=Escherichia phage LL5 TaxID=2233992 RepID=A0A2Z4Q364_9CAUD|nr:hypothetical protein HOT39_gp52 [Escherichia phage LL5]AWY04354.1 hypothetical protein CPT_LL5_52 [Escherichia phage LL5]